MVMHKEVRGEGENQYVDHLVSIEEVDPRVVLQKALGSTVMSGSSTLANVFQDKARGPFRALSYSRKTKGVLRRIDVLNGLYAGAEIGMVLREHFDFELGSVGDCTITLRRDLAVGQYVLPSLRDLQENGKREDWEKTDIFRLDTPVKIFSRPIFQDCMGIGKPKEIEYSIRDAYFQDKALDLVKRLEQDLKIHSVRVN